MLDHRAVKLAAARVEVLHLGGVSGCRWHAVSWPAPPLLAPVLTLPNTHPPTLAVFHREGAPRAQATCTGAVYRTVREGWTTVG